MREAVSQHARNFTEIVVLKAEISWKEKQPQFMRVAVDYAALEATRRPIGIALRIGPYAGPFTKNGPIAFCTADTAAALVAEARTNQID